MMKELISVLIPTFNREKYVEACITSMLEQSYQPLQIMVYDDGSTDRTVDIVRTYPQIVLIEGTTNRGVSYARNQLLKSCNTRYAAWQDSDDVSNIYRLEMQYEALQQSDAPIAYCQFSYHLQLPASLWKRESLSLALKRDPFVWVFH